MVTNSSEERIGSARIVELEDDVVVPTDVKKPLLFIATPAYGCMLTVQFMQCMLQTQLALQMKGVGIIFDCLGNESLITRARNLLTKRFLQSDASHLVFIDADISWDPAAILRLLEKNEGVVTTSYPKKFIDWNKVKDHLSKDQEPGGEPLQQVGLDFNLNVTTPTIQVENGFAKVLDAATGFMMVKREVIEKMYSHYEKELLVVNDLLGAQQTIKDYVAVFDCMIDPVSKRSLSEDFAFSRRWQALGGDVWMDLGTPLGHTGGFHYEGNIKERVAFERGVESLRQPPPPLGVPEDNKSQDTEGRKRVLFAMLPRDERVSLGYVTSVTKLLGVLQSVNRYAAQFSFFQDKNDACDAMWGGEWDCLVFLDSMLGFPAELIVDMLESASPLHAGVYPKATMNWEQVQEFTQESVNSRGLQYDVRLLPTSTSEAVSAPLGIAKLDRCVLERLQDRLDPRSIFCNGKKRLWFHEGVYEDRKLSSDELFCLMWGSGVTLNLSHAVSLLGNMTFVGLVVARKQLR